MISWYARIIGSSVLANLMLAGVVIAGIMAATTIRRESNPDIFIPMISISVPYPGGDPEDIEESITQKIAAVVDGMQGVNRYFTWSGEGMSEVDVEIREGANLAEVKDRIENGVDAIDTFPERAERPRIRQSQDEDSVAIVFVWGDLSERELKEQGELIRAELQALPEVSIVEPFGMRGYEIAIEVSEQALHRYDLTLQDVAGAIRRSSLNASTGTLQLEAEEMRVRALGRRYTGPEFESIVVKALPGGETLTLGQIAAVRDAFEENERVTTLNGNRCYAMDVDRSRGEDLLKINRAVDRYIAEKQPALPEGVHITKAFDDARFVQGQIGILVSNGLAGLALVLFMLWLFLEPRLAFWVAMGIPISLMGAMVVLWVIGASLNQISLIAMILVLGMIVDDAIVTGEAIHVHRERGLSPLAASVAGVREVALPVFASIATSVLAFLPMAFLGGLMGQFMRQMPLVVTTALVVSFAECMLMLPAHLNYRRRLQASRLPRALQFRRHVTRGLDAFVARVYIPLLVRCIRHRYVASCAAVSIVLITVGLIAGGIVPVMMWPPVEGESIQAYVEFPPGTPLAAVAGALELTEAGLERVAARTKTKSGDPLVRNVWLSAPDGVDTGGRLYIELLTTSKRGIPTEAIIADLREEVGRIPGAIVQSYRGDTIGNGDGGDVGVWLTGADYKTLRRAADELKAKLASYDGVYQVQDNFRPGKGELQVRPKPAARHLGLTLDDISRQLYAAYQGEEAVTLLRAREEVKVRVMLPRAERERLSDFTQLRIRTPGGGEVPLTTVADVTLAAGVSSISGINGLRGIQVSASVDRARANPNDINQSVEDYLPGLLARYPGVGWTYSPNEADNRAMFAALGRNSIIAGLVIFILLCTIFHSYVQPLLILTAIPFGFTGAVIGHLVLGIPLSFLSLAGMIALAGVIVNTSIVLIERMNAFLREGFTLEESICRAGERRFRAVVLTSVTTVFGLSPIILNQSLMAQIVIPMAVSLAAGVGIGTLLSLVFLPTFAAVLNDARRAVFRSLRGSWPTPEEVEPATRTREDDVNEGASANPASA
jgi:multidrug efflux pump subunit AcrB